MGAGVRGDEGIDGSGYGLDGPGVVRGEACGEAMVTSSSVDDAVTVTWIPVPAG